MENYKHKLIELDDIIRLNPNDGDVYYNKALYIQEYFTENKTSPDVDWDEVFHWVYENANKAIELNTQIANAYFLRGLTNMAYGEEEKAEADFEQTIVLDALHAKANHNLAIIYLQKKEYEKALDFVNKSIGVDPDEGANYLLRGQLLGMLGNREEMDADFRQTLELLGELDYIYRSRATVHINNDRYEEALTDLGKVIELDPVDKDSYLLIAFLQDKLGDEVGSYTTRIEMAESEYFELDTTLCSSLYCNRGVARLNVEGKEDDEGAMADFDKSLEYAPDMTLALYNRAGLHKSQGNLQQALDDAQSAIDIEREAGINVAKRMSKSLIAEIKADMGIKPGFWERVKDSISGR